MVGIVRLAAIVGGCSLAWSASELGHSTQSAWNTPRTIVVDDSAAFRLAWNGLYSEESPRPALPVVDFKQYHVFVIASGYKPTGGYRMALSGAHVVHDTALITVTLYTPPAGCGVTQQITTPAIAIAVPVKPALYRIISTERPDTVRCN